MFLKKNNVIKVYFIDNKKAPRVGVVKSFDNNFFVIQFYEDDFETLIPYSSVSIITAVEPKIPIGDKW